MNKAHVNKNWEDYPSNNTALDAKNLNDMDKSIDAIDDRVIVLDTTKLDKSDAQLLVRKIEYNRQNGMFTITYFNGSTATIDTMLEKLAVNFDYDPVTQRLIIILDDGEVKYVDLKALITQYEFLSSDTIDFQVQEDGKVKAVVEDGSIEEKHLRPNYLADIKVEAGKAQASAAAVAISEANALKSENAAKASQTAAKTSETNAATSAANAAKSADTATSKATAASNSATAAETSKTNAKTSEANAKTSETNANRSKTEAATSATNAATSATNAAKSATSADAYAKKSQSYAVGGTGTRAGEDTDNAGYYYEQSKRVIQGVSGIVPMGTISFDGLSSPSNQKQGYMFNVSNSFVSDDRFQDGGGVFYGAGNNILYTADGKWDVLAGVMVSGVKGDKETEYRQGFVNLTPKDIGIVIDGELSDVSKNPVENKVIYGEIEKLKKSVADGKASVASAIAAKGVPTAQDATFAALAENISLIGGGDNITLAGSPLIIGYGMGATTAVAGYEVTDGKKYLIVATGGEVNASHSYDTISVKLTAKGDTVGTVLNDRLITNSSIPNTNSGALRRKSMFYVTDGTNQTLTLTVNATTFNGYADGSGKYAQAAYAEIIAFRLE